MVNESEPASTGGSPENRPPMGRWRRLLHLAFWTLLFYCLAVLVAKIAEWASR